MKVIIEQNYWNCNTCKYKDTPRFYKCNYFTHTGETFCAITGKGRCTNKLALIDALKKEIKKLEESDGYNN